MLAKVKANKGWREPPPCCVRSKSSMASLSTSSSSSELHVSCSFHCASKARMKKNGSNPFIDNDCTIMMHVFREKNYIPQDVEISMWDGICVSPQNACAQRHFGKNVPKRSVVTPRVAVGHLGWHFCPFFRHGACAETNIGKNVVYLP